MIERETLFISNVTVPAHRARGLNPEAVARLAESIKRLGLQTPISVRYDDASGDVVLVAGLHRLEAMRSLGEETIPAVYTTGTTDEARMWELAENLHRAELSEAERREHVAEWVALTAEKVCHGGTPLPGGAQPKESGIRKAAKELGLPVSSVKRAVDAESLSPDAKALADEVGAGTVQRAAAARAGSPEAQLRAIREESARAEARKANKDAFRDVAEVEAARFAEWILARMDLNERPQLLAWLRGTKGADVANALEVETA